jgi:hypothetical protein
MWRRRSIESALEEAAGEDEAFEPARLDVAVREIFWAATDVVARREPEKLDAFRHPDVPRLDWPKWAGIPKGEPDVEVETFQNHAGAGRDRVTFRLIYELAPLNHTHLEYWTLKRHGDGWLVAAIGDNGSPAPLVATPWEDPHLPHDAALELAARDAVDDARLREVSAGSDALDLSLLDERTAPHVLEAVVRITLDAWAASVDGDRSELEAVADERAVRTLLAPRAGSRILIRRPELLRLEVEALEPPVAVVRLELRARRWLASTRGVLPRMGRAWRRSRFTERWTFRLTGDARRPWRLSHADPPRWT